MEYIIEKGRISDKELRGILNISPQAAHKEINKLVKLDVIKPKSKGRGLYYDLK